MFKVERDAEIAVIRLDNPPVNAVSFERWRGLPPLLGELERDGVAALVFTGLPQRHFCGGNDFREFASLTPGQTLAGTGAVRDALRAVHDSPIPSIAALHGAAMGSGFMLSCACDFRFATSDAKLGLPEVKVDAFGGYRIVREVLSQGEARMLTLTGRPISGARAHQIGLVQELGETPDTVLARAVEVAHELAGTLKGPMRAGIKSTLNREDELDLWTAYDLERDFASSVMGQAMASAR
ncbi:crotonase [Skermanella stibiiresistens SB22]|uniref:Crotonase n=1 Tax=Skermanella stibiiresistens SB22 TaxID=1385369 RepID=W9H1Q7_9PROT|nr:enoyl-CoA hydratase/isomerase family protein [Skermanella stibiiresistens]EWY38627.1 crotonase [Skermanella stibiiresistens SB22]